LKSVVKTARVREKEVKERKDREECNVVYKPNRDALMR